jgi:hypothetical protein
VLTFPVTKGPGMDTITDQPLLARAVRWATGHTQAS